jgi:hypothetical protein
MTVTDIIKANSAVFFIIDICFSEPRQHPGTGS